MVCQVRFFRFLWPRFLVLGARFLVWQKNRARGRQVRVFFYFFVRFIFLWLEPAFYFLVVGGLRFPNYQKHRAPKCKVTGLWSPRSGFSCPRSGLAFYCFQVYPSRGRWLVFPGLMSVIMRLGNRLWVLQALFLVSGLLGSGGVSQTPKYF